MQRATEQTKYTIKYAELQKIPTGYIAAVLAVINIKFPVIKVAHLARIFGISRSLVNHYKAKHLKGGDTK